MDSYLCVNIPIKMIAYTDLDGKITPMRFQFTDADGSLVTVKIDRNFVYADANQQQQQR